MAPPQQAGKFKPRRKPKKIIRPGATSGAAASETGTSGSSNPSNEAAPPSVGSSSTPVVAPAAGGRGGRGRSDSRTRGGRSAGRGGRDGRGRGRGRIPIQQGSAFFTAAPAPTKKTSRASSSSRASAAVSRRLASDRKLPTHAGGQADETVQQEEIVGMMEETIGGPVPEQIKSTKASRALTREGQETAQMDLNEGAKVPEDETQYTYDSDSSRESRRSTTGVLTGGTFVPDDEPLRLPFPPSSTPIGIGNKAMHPISLLNQDDESLLPISAPVGTNESNVAAATEQNRPSPFVDTSEVFAFQQEKDSWFLMQFPTRLPPLNKVYNQEGKIKAEDVMDDSEERNHAAEHNSKIETAEVSISPVKFDQFDNAMVNALPGKMGRIQIHQSGKTYLLLQAKDGTEIRLKLSEGLGCTFQQQAAVIDVDNANFVQLGKIGKTVVATPDL